MQSISQSQALPWRESLSQAVINSGSHVVGEHDTENEAQSRVIQAFLSSYHHENALFYIEPCFAHSTYAPADLIVVHPSLGVLVVEVKGWSIDFINRIEAGSFYIQSTNYPKPQNPFKATQKKSLEIKNAAERIVDDIYDLPLFPFVIALPNISEQEWCSRDFDKALPMHQILFKEHFESQSLLQAALDKIVGEGLQRANKRTALNSSQVLTIRKLFGDTAVLIDDREFRLELPEDKLGVVFDEMSKADKQLSDEQQEYSRINLQGHPRLFRGVAGSGKSVILSNLVARYIKRKLQEPEDLFLESTNAEPFRVGVICFNRTLAPFLRAKIEKAYKSITQTDLPKDALWIGHYQSLTYDMAQLGKWDYIRVNDGTPAEAALRYLEMWQDPTRPNKAMYDAVFVDEGQDLEPEQYRLLHEIIKTEPDTAEKNLIVFYDDAQNLYGRTRPNWKSLGLNVVGGRSRVMQQCFRNTNEIVTLAFNVLLGMTAPEEIKVKTRRHADINYLKDAGLVEEFPTHIKVNFASRKYMPPIIRALESSEAERKWLVDELEKLIVEESVRPEDILILCASTEAAKLQRAISERITEDNLDGFVLPFSQGNKEDLNRYIFQPKHLTISTIHGSKGYDAHVVFLIGTDNINRHVGQSGDARAAFYVAATRAKNILYISGVEKETPNLLKEAQAMEKRLIELQ